MNFISNIFGKRKTIRVSQHELDLIRAAEAEARGQSVEELDSDDNMPPTLIKMLAAKRNGKGFKNLTAQGNLYENKTFDDINKRFEENELRAKRSN